MRSSWRRRAVNGVFTLMLQGGGMGQLPEYLTPETWLVQIFSSAEARRGGVVKRQIRDVERLVGREAFAREVARRGFQAVENGRHFVVFCNGAPIRRVRESAFERAL